MGRLYRAVDERKFWTAKQAEVFMAKSPQGRSFVAGSMPVKNGCTSIAPYRKARGRENTLERPRSNELFLRDKGTFSQICEFNSLKQDLWSI